MLKLFRVGHRWMEISLWMIIVAHASYALAQSQRRTKDSSQFLQNIVVDKENIVVDKQLSDIYVRLMRYQTAGQDNLNYLQDSETKPEDYLTIAVTNLRLGPKDKLSNYLKTICAERSNEALVVQRKESCIQGDSCYLSYAVDWIKEPEIRGQFACPSERNVAEYLTYDLEVSYKDKSLSHKGVIAYYRSGGPQSEFLVYDGIIPQINMTSSDKLPTINALKVRKAKAFTTATTRTEVRKLSAMRIDGSNLESEETGVPIGYLPGDDTISPQHSDERIVMDHDIEIRTMAPPIPCSPPCTEGANCEDEGDTSYCSIDKCAGGICTHTRVDPITAPSPDPEPLDTEHLTAETQTAMNCLTNAAQEAGGNVQVTSGYRSQAYQDHLREVWNKWQLIKDWVETECTATKQNINTEWLRHGLAQEPVPESNHTTGRSFDGRPSLPAGTSITTLASGCQLSSLAENNGIYHFTR
jgi:hypothetical protein